MSVFGAIHIRVDESTPRLHTRHGHGGRISLALTDPEMAVYLYGTPDDIVAWAQKVVGAARTAPVEEA